MLISSEICQQLTDHELVSHAVEDVDYFSCIYGRYEKKLLRYIKRLTDITNEEAEDILQESFIKVWKNLNRIKHDTKLSSWLYRLVHNEVISRWRKRKKQRPLLELSDNLLHSIADDLEITQLPEEQLNQELKNISEKYREIVILKYFENMSYEEISDILKIPEGTVAIRLNRAKKEMKARLKLIAENL